MFFIFTCQSRNITYARTIWSWIVAVSILNRLRIRCVDGFPPTGLFLFDIKSFSLLISSFCSHYVWLSGGRRGSIFRDNSYSVSSSITRVLSRRYCVTWKKQIKTSGLKSSLNSDWKRYSDCLFRVECSVNWIRVLYGDKTRVYLRLKLDPVGGLLKLTDFSYYVWNLRQENIFETLNPLTHAF